MVSPSPPKPASPDRSGPSAARTPPSAAPASRRLQFALQAPAGIVADDHHDRQLVPHRGIHFGDVESERAIAGDQRHRPAGMRQLQRQAVGQRRADGAQRTQPQPSAGMARRQRGAAPVREIAAIPGVEHVAAAALPSARERMPPDASAWHRRRPSRVQLALPSRSRRPRTRSSQGAASTARRRRLRQRAPARRAHRRRSPRPACDSAPAPAA